MIENRLPILLAERRMKVTELARLSGVSYKTLLLMYHGKTRRVDFGTLDGICNALECQPGDILVHRLD